MVHCPYGLRANVTACPVDPTVPDMFVWLVLIALFLVIYQPLVLFGLYGEFPLAPRYIMCLAVLWTFSWLWDPKRLSGNIVAVALLVYASATVVSALFSPYEGAFQNYHFQTWIGHVLLFVIFITSVKTERDWRIVLIGFVVIYFAYMVHSYLGNWNRIAELTGGYGSRLSGTGGRDANFFATGIVCTIPLLLPLVTLCKRYWHYLFILGFILLATRLVVLSASRGGLVALVALAILPILFSRHRFKILPFVILALPLGWFSMGEQYQIRFRSIVDPTVVDFEHRGSESARQGRIRGFQISVNLWVNNPISGVGPGMQGFIRGLDPHNLPGQLMGETGTLGIITFLFLLSCFGINHYNIWKNYKYLHEKDLGTEGLFCWRVSIATMYGVVSLLFQGLSLHNAHTFHWVWFAAFHALAAVFIQEKVTAAIQGKLLPNPPARM